MSISINAKQLRALLPEVVRRVRKGDRFTVIYRSRPAFRIVPVDDPDDTEVETTQDSLYRAPAVGASTDGGRAADHDDVVYGR